jgi:general stress protein 26
MEEKKQETLEKLKSIIKDVEVAMLTTIDDGVMRSRPMQTQKVEFDGDLWFFTSSQTHKAEEIEKDNRVNVSYAAPADNSYVSVSGTAEIVTDKAKMEELWNPILKAWFPKGLEEPNIVLLKIKIEQAEYWDTSSSSLVQAFGLLKSLVTGKPANGGEHEKISL